MKTWRTAVVGLLATTACGKSFTGAQIAPAAPPTVTLLAPARVTYGVAGALTLTGTCSDVGTGNVALSVSSTGGGSFAPVTADCAGGSWTARVDVGPLGNGTLSLVATHTNAGGVAASVTAAATLDQTPLGLGYFTIGVFAQPNSNFATWRQRGINTLVEVPSGSDPAAWTSAAAAAQLNMIRTARTPAAVDEGQSFLQAWAHVDEPDDVTGGGAQDYSTVAVTPNALQVVADGLRAALAVNTYFPIYLNLIGPHVVAPFINQPLMTDYVSGRRADVIAHDYYQINRGEALTVTYDGETSTAQGLALDRLTAWSGGKAQLAFIECNDQSSTGNLPTPAQMTAEAWSAVIHGAMGIVYFPIQLPTSGNGNTFSFDSTPAANVSQMTQTHDRLREIQNVLIDPVTGNARGTLWKMSPSGTPAAAGMLDYPFEGRVITTANGSFKIVLNLSNAAASLTSTDFGASALSFAAYEVKSGYDLNVAPTVTNLLVNPGFESGPAGWSAFGGIASVASDTPHGGANYLNLTGFGGGLTQTVSGIVPGAMYRLSAWALVADSAQGVATTVAFLDSGGTTITSAQLDNTALAYTYASLDATAPTGAVSAAITVYKSSGTGVAKYDDFSFARVTYLQ